RFAVSPLDDRQRGLERGTVRLPNQSHAGYVAKGNWRGDAPAPGHQPERRQGDRSPGARHDLLPVQAAPVTATHHVEEPGRRALIAEDGAGWAPVRRAKARGLEVLTVSPFKRRAVLRSKVAIGAVRSRHRHSGYGSRAQHGSSEAQTPEAAPRGSGRGGANPEPLDHAALESGRRFTLGREG